MSSSKRSKTFVLAGGAVAMALLLSGCADNLNNWDSSSARVGNAGMANTAIQEIEPWPPAAYRSTVGSGG